VFVIPVERARANAFFFDGLNSGADTETLTLSGKFISDGSNHKLDNYILFNRNDDDPTNNTYNKTPPIIRFITDTFWLFTSRNGGSVEYNTKETWNELLSKRYPALYDRLLRQYMSKFN
jgi:hypothetical protein